jgi:hypothetical protein
MGEKRLVVPLVLGGGDRSLLSISTYELEYLTCTPSLLEFETSKLAYEVLYKEVLQFGSVWIEKFLSSDETLNRFCSANNFPKVSVLIAGIFARAKIHGWIYGEFNFRDLYRYEVDS